MTRSYHHRSDTIGPHQGYRDDAPSAGSGECSVSRMNDEDYELHRALLARKRIRRGAVHDQVVEAMGVETPQMIDFIFRKEN